MAMFAKRNIVNLPCVHFNFMLLFLSRLLFRLHFAVEGGYKEKTTCSFDFIWYKKKYKLLHISSRIVIKWMG